jgi:hypothetical protein
MRHSYGAAALALVLAFSGCYGSFNLTRKLYKWNGEVGGKWTNEAVFLGFVILPVYMFATLGDAIVFNSIEFWRGKNPVVTKQTRTVEDGDKQAVMTYAPAARRLRVDSFEKGHPKSTVVFEPYQDGMAAWDGDGKLLMTAKQAGEEVVLRDPSGKEVGRYGSESLRNAQERKEN